MVKWEPHRHKFYVAALSKDVRTSLNTGFQECNRLSSFYFRGSDIYSFPSTSIDEPLGVCGSAFELDGYTRTMTLILNTDACISARFVHYP